MSQYRFGIIGLGGIADMHIRHVVEHPQAVVWAICDVAASKLEERGKQYDIPSSRQFTNFYELLQSGEVHAVIIGTPNAMHVEIALAAIEAGVPFVLEKPVAMNQKEAKKLWQAMKLKPVKHMIGFSYRYKSAIRYAKQYISEGKLGNIRHVYADYLQSWADDVKLPLYWRFVKADSGSGTLGDLGAHVIDLISYLTGEKLLAVAADCDTIIQERQKLDGSGVGKVDVDDYAHVLAKLSNQISAAVNVTRFAKGRSNYQRMEIYGELGSLVYRLEENDEIHVHHGDGSTNFTPIRLDETNAKHQFQSFIDILEGCEDGHDADVEAGFYNQLYMDAILQAAAEQKWVEIQPQ